MVAQGYPYKVYLSYIYIYTIRQSKMNNPGKMVVQGYLTENIYHPHNSLCVQVCTQSEPFVQVSSVLPCNSAEQEKVKVCIIKVGCLPIQLQPTMALLYCRSSQRLLA